MIFNNMLENFADVVARQCFQAGVLDLSTFTDGRLNEAHLVSPWPMMGVICLHAGIVRCQN